MKSSFPRLGRYFRVVVLLLLISTVPKASRAQAAIVPRIDMLVELSEMRPMALVKFLTERLNNPWQLLSDAPFGESRKIIMVKGDYEMATIFDDETDMLFYDTPRDDKFYSETVDYFTLKGFAKTANTKDGYYIELWDNSKTHITDPTMISIQTAFDSNGQPSKRTYTVVMHP